MTKAERDRLVVLRKAKRGLMTQREAALELDVSIRHVKRLVRGLKEQGDKCVIHGLRGRPSPRRIGEDERRHAIEILSTEVYRGFGPTLACEYLSNRHDIHVSKETLRKWMMKAGLWRGKRRRMETVHPWRPRRSRCGELVQWDTSDHDWLEGRGPRLYLVSMIDDATSRLHARFVARDSTAENMRVLWAYLQRYGRPLAFYTTKRACSREQSGGNERNQGWRKTLSKCRPRRSDGHCRSFRLPGSRHTVRKPRVASSEDF